MSNEFINGKASQIPRFHRELLDYCWRGGYCVLRYDNEAGKGDHKHVGEEELPYVFTMSQALLDALTDVRIKADTAEKEAEEASALAEEKLQTVEDKERS